VRSLYFLRITEGRGGEATTDVCATGITTWPTVPVAPGPAGKAFPSTTNCVRAWLDSVYRIPPLTSRKLSPPPAAASKRTAVFAPNITFDPSRNVNTVGAPAVRTSSPARTGQLFAPVPGTAAPFTLNPVTGTADPPGSAANTTIPPINNPNRAFFIICLLATLLIFNI
jgi:hypothetical protein